MLQECVFYNNMFVKFVASRMLRKRSSSAISHSTIMRNWIVLSAANHSEASFTYKSMTKDITTGNYYSSVVSVERNFWASQVWQNIHRQSITTLYLVVYTAPSHFQERTAMIFMLKSTKTKTWDLIVIIVKNHLQIRGNWHGIINKILRLEQEGEHLHAVINRIERNLTMTLNKSTRYWQVLRDYENKLYNGLK